MTEVGEDALGLLTIPEAAAMLRLGKRTVWRKVHDGEIESITIGRSRRITRQTVADYIAERRAAMSAAPSGDQSASAA
jgi:excisionase family DNA binding protein